MNSSNQVFIVMNAAFIAGALFLLALSLWLAPVDLSTKGYWGMGVVLLSSSLVNFVKFRMDERVRTESLRGDGYTAERE